MNTEDSQVPRTDVVSFKFGDNEDLCNELLRLVRSGHLDVIDPHLDDFAHAARGDESRHSVSVGVECSLGTRVPDVRSVMHVENGITPLRVLIVAAREHHSVTP